MIPFGKYRGHPLIRLADDPDYVAWLKAQDWLQDRYPEVHAYVHAIGIPALRYCSALTREGNPCAMRARYGEVCTRHFHRDTLPDFAAWESEMATA